MKGWLSHAWQRSKLGTRIAASIILALVAVQGLAVLQFFLTFEPQLSLYGARWLVAASGEAAGVAFSEPPERRTVALRSIPAAKWLIFSWQPEMPELAREADRLPPFGDRLEATLRQQLSAKAKNVVVTFAPRVPRGLPRPDKVVFRPPELEKLMPSGAIKDGEPELAVPGFFRIDIQGPDGTWLSIMPLRQRRGSLLGGWPLLPVIGGTLVVALLSVLTARRILAPLDDLTRAARRLGVERRPEPIASKGLGEFAAIADAFNDMQCRLKRFVDDRTQMLAAMSHDLRTSLTRLKLSVEELEESEPKRAIANEIDEMDAMISATLSFASGDAQGEESRAIDIASLLISLCDEVMDRGHRAVYQGPDHARLRCQPVAMKRALSNVIDNAVKYGNRADVTLEMATSSAIIRVLDEGPGIAPHQIEDAFAPFRRLESSRNRLTGGVGLGLTIARDVVQAHGGAICLENRIPTGLVLSITLPVS